MKCSKCSTEITEDAKFCPKCGEAVPVLPTQTGNLSSPKGQMQNPAGVQGGKSNGNDSFFLHPRFVPTVLAVTMIVVLCAIFMFCLKMPNLYNVITDVAGDYSFYYYWGEYLPVELVWDFGIIIYLPAIFFSGASIINAERTGQKSEKIISRISLILNICGIMLHLFWEILFQRSWYEFITPSCVFLIIMLFAAIFISGASIIILKKTGRKDIHIISRISLTAYICTEILVTSLTSLTHQFETYQLWGTEIRPYLMNLLLICFFLSIGFTVINIVLVSQRRPQNISPIQENTFVPTCPKCGKPVPGNKKFCSNCGEKINNQ